ncbi:uncharacterized protein J4E88_002207 [Alternaria novae-zelandiae]|uniref:uncharacterized protein n=1 Tax=Alternaria novae-zelandiae TaxID=430562 RepID=UPI0020C2531A|nr:uncharacterized protein J4E88_002207 [Alternaria novae-zelandiae]KAI4690734.1 hypothetical protein J4E88_002207 [Alternaria novae-zelandiae]
MIQLPVELQRGCIDFLSDDLATLKALRLVNKGFHELASESLFRTVSFTNVGNSPERFLNIIHSSLQKHVRHAIINTSEHPDREQNEEDEDEEQDDDDDDNGRYLADGPDILCTFADAITQLPQLESLKRTELKFSSICTVEDYTHTRYRDTMLQIREDENFRAKIQDLCFQALAQSESFESLTIQNLQDAMPQDVMESKSFLAVRERLTELRLRILRYHVEPEGGQSTYADAQHNGLRRFLPKYWLKPTTNQLTRLTLDCDCLWGVWPFTDFREVEPFPHLKSLCFGNWTIAHDWQVDWIVAHGATLETLLLCGCGVVRYLALLDRGMKANFPQLLPQTGDDETDDEDDEGSDDEGDDEFDSFGLSYGPEWEMEPDIRWHHLFERFRVGLQRLRYFKSGYSQDYPFDSRYNMRPDHPMNAYYSLDCRKPPGFEPIGWDVYEPELEEEAQRRQETDLQEEDRRALTALMETVEQRVVEAI